MWKTKERGALYAIFFTYLCWWLSAKLSLFHQLAYTADLFTFTQASHTWLQGLPLFYEHYRGADSWLHNNFIILLFGPLTLPLGAYGIILAAWAVQLLALLSWLRYSLTLDPLQRNAVLILLAIFLLGPFSFWIWDDPMYGWHPENLYLPFAMLMLLSLLRSSRAFYLWAALLALVRQDGALVGWAVHTCFLLLSEKESSERSRRTVRAAIGWALIFAAGMTLLVQFGVPGKARTAAALAAGAAAFHDPRQRWFLAVMCAKCAIMLSPLLLLLLCPRGKRALTVLAACLAPLIAVNLVASFAYLPVREPLYSHGLTWSPRFAMLWAPGSTALLLTALADQHALRNRKHLLLVASAGLLLQLAVLYAIRGYHMPARFLAPLSGKQQSALLGDRERAFLRCLARTLPHDAAVVSFGGSEAYFHRHINLWADNAARQGLVPDVVVCEEGERFHLQHGCRSFLEDLPKEDYKRLLVGGLSAAIGSKWTGQLQECH